jgi:3-hydroxy-9,10-secoandrosta-1,3,5(10)-triene-9,17-dione monooxygenase
MANPRMTDDAAPSIEELVARAHAMLPGLIAGADAVEKARQVPAATIEQYRQAGFFRILQPRAWGGWEMPPEAFYQVVMELGRGCGSSAWNLMIIGVHQWEMGQFSEQARTDVWGQDREVLISSSYAPFGTARRVDGGYVLNGTWRTSSGCDHAQWAIIGARIVDASNRLIDRRSFLVPRTDYEIVDDWHTFALAGTGSKSLVLKNVFVPDHRGHSLIEYPSGDQPLLYRLPFGVVFYLAGASIITGFAQGAVDTYIDQMKVRTNVLGAPGLASASPYVKDRLGNAVSRVRTARMRILSIAREALGYAQRNERIPTDERVKIQLDLSRCGRDSEEAVMLLYKALAARALFLDNPIQRYLRDTLGAANHPTMNADDNAGVLGGYLLGYELPLGAFEMPTYKDAAA